MIDNVNGYTLTETGKSLQTFEAVAFEDGKILAVGETAALRKRYPDTARIDGRGKTMLPGFIDAHGHVIELGMQESRVQFDGSRSLAEAQERIRSYLRSNTTSSWVLGGGWNQVIWELGRFPISSELDAAVPDRPAALDRVDGHAKWLNSIALSMAGIRKDTPDPPGGRIERDSSGNPTGVLVDKAMSLVDNVIPAANDEEVRSAVRVAIRELNSVGLTSVGDAGNSAREIAVYRDLADRGELTLRVYAMIRDTGSEFDALSKSRPLVNYAKDLLSVRAVKLFAYGALGSRGAALLAPYSDQPTQRGLLFHSDAELEGMVEKALAAGYQVNIHAIGDAANRQVLDAFDAAYRRVGGRQLRNRIEHAQIIASSDIPRIRALDLIASMQPTHATSDMNMAEERIGRDRLRGAYAWRTLLDQGTKIAGGSDFPVESPNPFFGIHAAVTRTDHENQPPGGWHSEQAMTVMEAFRAFTLDAAYAQHEEDSLGSLEPGKWADFILVDRDLFKIPVSEIWNIKVEQTWLAGRRVY